MIIFPLSHRSVIRERKVAPNKGAIGGMYAGGLRMDNGVVKLQREIHTAKHEQPYKSGQLAAMLGVPISHCAWLVGSWQQRAFEAGYRSADKSSAQPSTPKRVSSQTVEKHSQSSPQNLI